MVDQDLPFQSPFGDADTLETASEAASSGASSIISFDFLLNSSLSSLWSLLNSVQISAFFELFEDVKFPFNSSVINKVLVDIATFDIINTEEWIDPSVVTWGEGIPFSYNFEQTGLETTWMLANSSAVVWMYLFHVALLLLFLPFRLFSKVTGTLNR